MTRNRLTTRNFSATKKLTSCLMPVLQNTSIRFFKFAIFFVMPHYRPTGKNRSCISAIPVQRSHHLLVVRSKMCIIYNQNSIHKNPFNSRNLKQTAKFKHLKEISTRFSTAKLLTHVSVLMYNTVQIVLNSNS